MLTYLATGCRITFTVRLRMKQCSVTHTWSKSTTQIQANWLKKNGNLCSISEGNEIHTDESEGGWGCRWGDIPLRCCRIYSPPDNHTLTGNKDLLIVWSTILMID